MTDKKEQKVTEQNTVDFVAETAEQRTVDDFVVETTADGNFVIVREPIRGANGKQLKTQDGRLYFAYLLRGKLNNRSVKVDFSPKDKGGYELLDIVFEISPKAELIISEVIQEINGVKSRRTVYNVVAVDSKGVEWKSEIKPTRVSDRDMLAMFISLINAQIKTETE